MWKGEWKAWAVLGTWPLWALLLLAILMPILAWCGR